MRKQLLGWSMIQQLLHQRHEQCFIGRLFDDLDAPAAILVVLEFLL